MYIQKREEFIDKEDFEIHFSDPIPPRVYGIVKTHKLEKNCPSRTVVSTVGTSPYGV